MSLCLNIKSITRIAQIKRNVNQSLITAEHGNVNGVLVHQLITAVVQLKGRQDDN